MAPVSGTGNPARDASAVIKSYWSFTDELPTLPVDPYAIAANLGISVYTAPLDRGTAGMLVKRAGQDPEIYLNRDDSENRQRFTCAHECGHYILHSTNDQDEWEYLDRRDAASSTGTRSQEVYANGFAAALLMPASVIRREMRSAPPANPIELAARLGVSMDAMNNRLANLGYR